VNERQDSSVRDGDVAQELVELLVVSDGQLDVSGNNSGLLVVARGVTSQLEDFSRQVFEDGAQVDRGSSSDAGSIATFTELTMDTSDGELETSSVRAALGGLGLLGAGSSLGFLGFFGRHVG